MKVRPEMENLQVLKVNKTVARGNGLVFIDKRVIDLMMAIGHNRTVKKYGNTPYCKKHRVIKKEK